MTLLKARWMRRVWAACAGAAAVALVGCAATVTEAQQTDSPLPIALRDGRIKTCAAGLSTSGKLAEGEQCFALVRAADWLTDTHLQVRAGQSYLIAVPDGQVWFDATRRNVAPHGDQGSDEMNVMADWKRHPSSQWFALMAAVMHADANGTMAQPEQAMQPVQDLSVPGELSIVQDGRLALYPNDAAFPLGDHKLFYGNNHGQIWVLIKLVKNEHAH